MRVIRLATLEGVGAEKNIETISVKKCNCQSIPKYPDFKDSFMMYLHFTRIFKYCNALAMMCC